MVLHLRVRRPFTQYCVNPLPCIDPLPTPSPEYEQAVKPLPVIRAQHALHLRALVDIESDVEGAKRKAGDEWQLTGPVTYIPQPEVVCVVMGVAIWY